MSLASEIRAVKERLQTILSSVNTALAEKGGAAAENLSTVPAAITALPIGSGEIVISGLDYVPGEPVSFTLSGWDKDLQGTTYTLKANGYKIGANGLQIGLPSNSSTVNAQAVVAAALTIVDTAVTAPDTEKNVAGYVTVTISAVNVPDRDITVAIFGLEEAEPVTVTTTAIEGISAPVTGEKPVKAITECEQYTGTVEWSPEVSGTFAASTAYTAAITLTPKPGYKLTGVAANFFTVAGAASVSNDADSGVVKAVFPATAAATTEETA